MRSLFLLSMFIMPISFQMTIKVIILRDDWENDNLAVIVSRNPGKSRKIWIRWDGISFYFTYKLSSAPDIAKNAQRDVTQRYQTADCVWCIGMMQQRTKAICCYQKYIERQNSSLLSVFVRYVIAVKYTIVCIYLLQFDFYYHTHTRARA